DMLTVMPSLATLTKGAVDPPLTQSTTRSCSVLGPAVTALAVKSGGAAPNGVTRPSKRTSDPGASVLRFTALALLMAYAVGSASAPVADPVPVKVSTSGW